MKKITTLFLTFLIISCQTDVKKEDLKNALEKAKEQCGISHFSHRLIRNLSGGYRQRVGIAQAIIHEPKLVVLDEPTNGLDPQQIAEMRQVLKDYAKTGRTVIVSSHLLAEVQQTCSHVVLMHRGKLIAFGPMKKILTKNRQARSLEEIFLELIGDDLVIGKELS